VSETPKKVNVEAALREWPDVEKPAKGWDEFAATVEARVRSGEPGASVAYASDENLLADPLGQINEDGHNSAAPGVFGGSARGDREQRTETPMTMPADRERDRRSLQDLAKMAQMTPPPPSVSRPSGVQRAAEAQKDDSGLVDLALAAQSDPGAGARAHATPLASQGLFDDEPASVRPGPLSGQVHAQAQQPVPSIPPMPASSGAPAGAISSAPSSMVAPQSSLTPLAPATGAATSSQITATPKKSGAGTVIALVLGGVVAVSAAAAGVVFFMHHQKTQALALKGVETTAPAVAAAPAEPAPKTVDTAAAPSEPAQAATEDEAELDPSDLPSGKTTARTRHRTTTHKTAAAKAEPAAPAPKKANEPAKVSQKDLPKESAGPAGALGDEMKKAVGDKDKQPDQVPAAGTTGPQFAPGSVPQKPSQGAVTGAIGAVLPHARACLGPDDPVSHATIVFGSTGRVQSVSVTGAAAGKPAEACIRGALSKAKVAPFAEPSYSARITVRH
jgi:hypothetical protein